jgi:hypothetical protein
MKRSLQAAREKVLPVRERDLAFARGMEDDASIFKLKQHVDNPAQTAMKDGE